MADDINTAINSGGYVIVPEKAVDGTGKDAIYVYMTYNSNGNQAWKIAGGLNGGWLNLALTILLILGMLTGASEILLLVGSIVSLVASIVLFLEDLEACLGEGPAWLGLGLIIAIGLIAFFVGTVAAAVYAAFGSYLATNAVSAPVNSICR